MKGLLVYISILAFIIVILVLLGSGGGDNQNEPNKYPQDEVNFISVVSSATSKYYDANNLQKEDIKNERNKGICQSIPKNGVITNWIGVVSGIDSTMDGDAILSVSIPNNIEVKTFNNTFSDIDSNTIIKKGSSLYNKVYQLKKGNEILFSGVFLKSPGSCAWEASITTDGGLSEPEFIFRFTDISE